MSRIGDDGEMELLYDDNKAAVLRVEQDGEGNDDNRRQMNMVEEDFKEEYLDDSQTGAVVGEQEDNKYNINGVVEDALERTINEVAETSLQSAAVEGEDLVNEDPKKKSKYDWDAPIVKSIVRRVKNHRLSHAKAAEQLSLLMDAKVTSIGVRLQVVKMANDEALAKQDQRAICTKTAKNENSSVGKATNKPTDASVKSRASKSPVSYRTRSKTGSLNQSTNSSQSIEKVSNVEVHSTIPSMENTNNTPSAGNSSNGNISLPTTAVTVGGDDAVNDQLYLPIVISQSPSSTVATKTVPPVIRLLDNAGKLTHIAVAEDGGYKLYRVNEGGGGTNAEHMQMFNQAMTAANNASVMSDPTTAESQGALKQEKSMTPSCSANYVIESVPAQQTLGALVGIPKFVNPQRYGGSNVYTRTFGPGGTPGSFQCAGVMRSRNEIKEEVKRLIRCIKSQHITVEEAVKQLFEYVALNSASVTLPDVKVNEADEGKQNVNSSTGFDTSLQRECVTEDGNEPYTRLIDEQGNMNIAVAEGDGYRVYRISKVTQNREVYKCADCDLLHRTKRDPIATVRITDGILCGEIHPVHHPKCPLQTLSVKECEQNSINGERESMVLHEMTTDVEEGRGENGTQGSGNARRTSKQTARKSRQISKSPPRKAPRIVPERSLGMTLRKRKPRILTSPGIYDSEMM